MTNIARSFTLSFGAFCAFVVITTLLGYPLGLLRLGLLPIYTLAFWRFGRNPLDFTFPLWLRVMKRVCYGTIDVGWKYDGNWLHGTNQATEAVRQRLQRPGLKVVIANHPANYFTVVPALGAAELIGPRLAVVLKHSHFLSPHGFGVWGIHGGIFINRLFQHRGFGWLRDFSFWMLRYQLRKLCRAAAKANQPISLVVMPDPRWTTKRWQQCGQDPQQRFIMRPKSGVLFEIMRAAAGLDIEFIDMTISVDREPAAIEGWFAFEGLVGADIWTNSNIVTADVQALAPDGDLSQVARLTVQQWLERRYARKTELYADWLESGGHRP